MIHRPAQNEIDPDMNDQRMQRRDVYHFAMEYRDRGYSVIPIHGKRPAIAWTPFQKRRASIEEMDAWFGPEAKDAMNLGIVTGSISQLVVVDTDDEGASSFWAANFPATPLVVISGGNRGGQHFYYQTPPHEVIRNRAGVLGQRIDIRGEGGLIVAPPSLHVETRNRYRWLAPLESYSLDEVPVFDPRWIGATEPLPPLPGKPLRPALRSCHEITNIRAYIGAIYSVAGSHGHNSCYRVACLLREAGLTADEALQEILVWNETNATPPWGIAELQHKIDSAFASHTPP